MPLCPVLHSSIQIYLKFIVVRRKVIDLIATVFTMGVGVHGGEQSKAGVQPHANVKGSALLPIGAPFQIFAVAYSLLRIFYGPTTYPVEDKLAPQFILRA